jgi:hypothetical protein
VGPRVIESDLLFSLKAMSVRRTRNPRPTHWHRPLELRRRALSPGKGGATPWEQSPCFSQQLDGAIELGCPRSMWSSPVKSRFQALICIGAPRLFLL